MPRPKRPVVRCPDCQAELLIVMDHGRARRCDPEAIAVLIPEIGAATGYRRHRCTPGASPQAELIPIAAPLTEDAHEA